MDNAIVMLSPPSQKSTTPEPRSSHEDCRWCPGRLAFTWREAALIATISSSQVLDEYITSGFFALIPALMQEFNLTGRTMTWPTSITSMVVSAFLLLFGRVVDMYGGSPVYATGIAWTLVWTLYAGFATDVPTLVLCRAMQGLGTAAYLPAGLATLATLYPPGPRKNMAFSIYGAMAPLGSFIGILVASLALQYAHWRWYFWIGAILALATLSGFLLARPSTIIGSSNRDMDIDWLGGMSLAVTTVLLVFTVTEAADAARGRRTPYILATGILAVVGIAVTAFVETHVAKQPLLPASIFKIRCIRPLLLGLLLNYGAVSLFTCYATLQ
jgi:MFS family permease